MTTIITRGFNTGIQLSPEARQRIKERLLSVGYSERDIKPIEWPDDAVSAHRSHRGEPWQFTTKGDLLREKQQKTRRNRQFERDRWRNHQLEIKRKRAYVWVFYVPDEMIFGGWWTYIIGCGFSCGSKKGMSFMKEVMELFPAVKPVKQPLLFETRADWYGEEEWMIEFAKQYKRCTRNGKPNGKAPVWVDVQGDAIVKIIGQAQWAKGSEVNYA